MAEPIDNESLRQEIALRAYQRFCDRGCVDGSDAEDWLIAEREVLSEQEQSIEAPKAQDNPQRPRNRKNGR